MGPKLLASMDRRKRSSARHILISVDESEGCERALQWTLDQLYRPGEASALFICRIMRLAHQLQ